MELQQFITTTLIEIAEGIADAQRQLRDKSSEAIINSSFTEADGHIVTGGRRRSVEFVEFDVAVVARENTEQKGGGGVAIASLFRAEAGVSAAQLAGSESRIKFKVPMSYPMHEWPEQSS